MTRVVLSKVSFIPTVGVSVKIPRSLLFRLVSSETPFFSAPMSTPLYLSFFPSDLRGPYSWRPEFLNGNPSRTSRSRQRPVYLRPTFSWGPRRTRTKESPVCQVLKGGERKERRKGDEFSTSTTPGCPDFLTLPPWGDGPRVWGSSGSHLESTPRPCLWSLYYYSRRQSRCR